MYIMLLFVDLDHSNQSLVTLRFINQVLTGVSCNVHLYQVSIIQLS
jgi:hypothetical protein